MKYVILLLCYISKGFRVLWVENSHNLEKISDWISNAKGFHLIQMNPIQAIILLFFLFIPESSTEFFVACL